MSELEEILAKHNHPLVSKQIKMTTTECPLCAQKKLVKWLKGWCTEGHIVAADLGLEDDAEFDIQRMECDKCMEALYREVLGEEAQSE